MLKWVRARGACVAVAVLASLASLGISLAGAHAGDCHDECIVLVVHGASAHQFSSGSSAPLVSPLRAPPAPPLLS